jgi:hypothetical protein
MMAKTAAVLNTGCTHERVGAPIRDYLSSTILPLLLTFSSETNLLPCSFLNKARLSEGAVVWLLGKGVYSWGDKSYYYSVGR